jgi:hypothetical protein
LAGFIRRRAWFFAPRPTTVAFQRALGRDGRGEWATRMSIARHVNIEHQMNIDQHMNVDHQMNIEHQMAPRISRHHL